MKKIAMLVLSTLLAACTQASEEVAPKSEPSASPAESSSDALGTWEGTGTTHDTLGHDLGRFDVSLTRAAAGPTKTRTDGKITLADGRQVAFWQETEGSSPSGFRLTSNHGSGGGRCFPNGMCQTYEVRDARAYATTITKDEKGGLRVLVTELEAGKAVQFHAQTLLRKP